MAQIRDLNTLLSLIGDGRAIAKINADFPEVVKALVEASRDEHRKKHKASITLKLDLVAENGVASVALDVIYKAPKRPPEISVFWLTKDGYFSDEHPKQINLFDRENAKVIEGRAAVNTVSAS